MVKSRQTAADREIKSIGVILRALEGLDGESIQRVLEYVFSRLSIAGPSHVKAITNVMPAQGLQPGESLHRATLPSIRDLKSEKQPKSSNQMAALVAYYLSEIAGGNERKDAINTADLQKYFKQA